MVVNAIIADADKNWCMALANELNVTKDFKVIKMINNGFKVISELERLKPKLIILDMDLPSISGLEIIQDIEKNNEINTEVIILTKKAINMSQVVGFKCVKCFLSKKAF